MSESYHIIQQSPLFPSTKVCSKCKQEKPIDAFGKHAVNRNGLRSCCKVCHNAENKKYNLTSSTRHRTKDGHRICARCQQEKPIEAFRGRSYCSPCHASYQREYLRHHPRPYRPRPDNYKKYRTLILDRRRNQKRRKSEYQILLAKQNGVCAICGQPESSRNQFGGKALAIDHDHKTNEIRGLLCQACNTGLGMFKDDPARLTKAIEYLQNAECKVEIVNS